MLVSTVDSDLTLARTGIFKLDGAAWDCGGGRRLGVRFACRARRATKGADLLVTHHVYHDYRHGQRLWPDRGLAGATAGAVLPNTGFLIAGAKPLGTRRLAPLCGAKRRAVAWSIQHRHGPRSAIWRACRLSTPACFRDTCKTASTMSGIGRLLALTPNEEANSYWPPCNSPAFGRDQNAVSTCQRHERERPQTERSIRTCRAASFSIPP